MNLDGVNFALAPKLSSFARNAAVPLAAALVAQLPWLALPASLDDVSQVQVKRLDCSHQFGSMPCMDAAFACNNVSSG